MTLISYFNFRRFILIAILGFLPISVIAQSPQPDSIAARSAADSLTQSLNYKEIRGIERAATPAFYTPRKVLHAIFWLPRFTIDAMLRSTAFSAVFIDEKRIFKKFEDFFYLYEDKLAWFPVLNIVSGSPRGLGVNLTYHSHYFTSQAKGVYNNNDIWGLKGALSYIFFRHNYFWQFDVETRLETDDNFRFYGIGPDPQNDPRSYFLPDTDAERGIYAQRRLHLHANIGVRTSSNLEYFYSIFYQKRTVRNPAGTAADNFSKVFDTDSLPGSFFKSKKIYNELSFRFDNRESLKIIEPGARIEGYGGLAFGLKNDKDRLFRAGLDAMVFLPVFRQNRLLVPRIVFDMVENLNDRNDIAFVEYPRHQEFRGASSKSLLRSDKYKMTASLEYQWPLAYYLNGHLFYDYLTVAPKPGEFFTGKPPWAAGFGIDFHTAYSEVARLFFSYGSEGLFFKLDVGLSSLNKDRSDWK